MYFHKKFQFKIKNNFLCKSLSHLSPLLGEMDIVQNAPLGKASHCSPTPTPTPTPTPKPIPRGMPTGKFALNELLSEHSNHTWFVHFHLFIDIE